MPRLKKKRQTPAAARRGPTINLKNHVSSKIAIFASRMSRAASYFYRERYGIGVVEWRVMMFVGYANKTSANRLCRETDLDKGAVSRSLNELQRKGIIRMKADGTDSRLRNVKLTAKGRALHDRIVPVALKRQRILLSGLSAAEVEKLMEFLGRLRTKAAGYKSSRDRLDTEVFFGEEPADTGETPRRRASSRRG